MQKITTGWFAVLAAFVSAGSLLAHHSLASYDTTKAVRIKGTVEQFNQINPHSILFILAKDAEGQTKRWAIEGPAALQLARSGFAKDSLKVGDTVEVCGYLPKEAIMWQLASPDTSTTSLAGRLINGETLVMPDGKLRSWGDYGVHKCFDAAYKDQHSK